MKQLLSILLVAICFDCLAQKNAQTTAPAYIFFLHNKFLEDQGDGALHPEYGKVEYKKTIEAFEKNGFKVISERRAKDTEVGVYALKVQRQVDSLLQTGVKPASITIIGTSKGGYIAMTVSGLLRNPQINYVFVGSCSASAGAEFQFYGRILSIYEKSDTIGLSCGEVQKSADKVSDYKEIEVNTGLKHGFLFTPLDAWVQPSIQWARGIKP